MPHSFLVDLRSDTVTKPTPAMRAVMAAAEVEDDVMDCDPTVRRLQALTAEMLGKEDALFVPSGSMSNQIAVRLHCSPGDELLCEAGCHIYNYEQGGCSQLSGVVAHPVIGASGIMNVTQLHGLVKPDDEHCVRTRLVALENTHNRGGGRILPLANVNAICDWAHSAGLRTHLDGARLWNAAIASGISEQEWCRGFDTVSVCFSKGLGAPIGSALAGPRDRIRLARRHRKVLGGGMRQVGIIAAGALYALEHQRERLREDHALARQLAATIQATSGLTLEPEQVDTNIVIFRVAPELGTAEAFVAALAAQGVRMLAFGGQLVRAVTHLDVHPAALEQACTTIHRVAMQLQ